jgi:hypothetical protein
MSEKNGDKARFHRERKAKINRKARMRAIRKELLDKAAKAKDQQKLAP